MQGPFPCFRERFAFLTIPEPTDGCVSPLSFVKVRDSAVQEASLVSLKVCEQKPDLSRCTPSLRSVGRESSGNRTVSFAMSPIFFNHTNATNSIKLTGSLRRGVLGTRVQPSRGCPCEIWFNQQPKFYLSVLMDPIIAVGCFAMSTVL